MPGGIPLAMACRGQVVSRGIEEDDETIKFQGTPDDLTKFLSTHKPSDPSWNKYVQTWVNNKASRILNLLNM